MTDASTPPAGQAPASAQAAQGTGEQPGGQAPSEETFDPDRAKSLISKLRQEAKDKDRELSAFRTAKQQADDATLSETAKLARERDAALAELEAERLDKRSLLNRSEVKLKAAGLGIVDPEAAAVLLDWDSVDYADDGTPKNIDQALRNLLKARPWLGSTGTGAAGNAMNPAANRGNGKLTEADVKKMSRDEINRRWTEIRRDLYGQA